MKSIDVYAISNIGNVRDNHEDNFYIPKNNYIDERKQSQIKDNNTKIEFEYVGKEGVFAVCDGMGGHNAGETASRIAVETISKNFDDILTFDKEKLLNFIKKLNYDICEYSDKNQNCHNMGTTFSGIVISNGKIQMIHVGDSRIYVYERNALKQISNDHTEGVRLVKAGILKIEDLLKMPNYKSLYKYLGRKGELVADYEQIELLYDAKIIISSDGLSDTISNERISDILSKYNNPKEICHNLIKECLDKGNACNDNITIICIKIN